MCMNRPRGNLYHAQRLVLPSRMEYVEYGTKTAKSYAMPSIPSIGMGAFRCFTTTTKKPALALTMLNREIDKYIIVSHKQRKEMLKSEQKIN